MGIIITFALALGVASLYQIVRVMAILAPTIAIYLCQPLFIVYSFIVDRHLKANTEAMS